MTSLYPFLLVPALHPKPWGGRALEHKLHKTLATDEPYGESWEVHDSTTVANGPYAGRTLGSLTAELGPALIGPRYNPAEGFPLLVKFLDAAEWLSIQDHPDDALAAKLEGEPRGKNEAWYILDAQPNAQLVIGVQPGTTREQVAAAIADQTLESLLLYAPVSAGDALYLAAGTIHALGPGIVLYEIQQSSDTTYRLYDWGRLGLDGKPRALHIEKGLAVANFETVPTLHHTASATGTRTDIVSTPYFETVRYTLDAQTRSVRLDTRGTDFHAVSVIEGSALVRAGTEVVALELGQTALIPAGLGVYVLATNDAARVLISAPA